MRYPTHYEIVVRGRVSDSLLSAFDGMTATASADATVLHGPISDQAALYGVLERVDSFGLELLGIRRTAAA
jgi:hypothetical protein